MLETVVLLSQAVSVAGLAAWLATGVRDNILHPAINELITAQVLEMSRLRDEYPTEFATVAHRAVTNKPLQRMAFRAVVLAELVAMIVLWVGVVGLCASLAGFGSVETSRAIALIGATLFTAIWLAFLVVGNHFSYWFCHEGAQNTHYQMTLWGLGNMIFLALA